MCSDSSLVTIFLKSMCNMSYVTCPLSPMPTACQEKNCRLGALAYLPLQAFHKMLFLCFAILAICSLTRRLQSTHFWVPANGPDNRQHTGGHRDLQTESAQGHFSEKGIFSQILYPPPENVTPVALMTSSMSGLWWWLYGGWLWWW